MGGRTRRVPRPFLLTSASNTVKGFVKRSAHVPARAAPLAPHHIRAKCDMSDASPSAPLGVKPVVLIGYACFLRSCNLLASSAQSWGGPHTMMAHHISTSSEGFLVYTDSIKTYGVLWGWIAYKDTVKPWPLGPAFVHQSGIPITPREVVGCMILALENAPDISPSKVSMHSLRRGATYAAVDQGLPIDDIKARGTWESDSGISPYLPVPKKVKSLRVNNLAN